MARAVLIAAIVLAAPTRLRADEGDVHLNLSVGLGTAYDLAGLRLEVGGGHFSGFVGLGLLAAGVVTSQTLSAPGGFGISAGARWYREMRKGFFLSTNVTDSWYETYYSFDETSHSNPRVSSGSLFTATVVAGYRRRWASGLLAEAGLGAGLYRDRQPQQSAAASPPVPGPPPAATYGLVPDIALGMGYEF